MFEFQAIEVGGRQYILVPKASFEVLVRGAAAFSPSPLQGEALGEYIHRIRCFLRMKEGELAVALETSQAQISRMESGKPVRDKTRKKVIAKLQQLYKKKAGQ